MDQMFPKWVRVAWIAVVLLFFSVGATKFLAQEEPSFYNFIPGSVFLGVFVTLELLGHFMAVLPHHEIGTAIALGAFALSVVVLFFAVMDKDPGRQAALAGFGGSLLGFATGIPFGQFRANKPNSTARVFRHSVS